MATVYAGIDVGKKELVMALNDRVSTWPNSECGQKNLITKLLNTQAHIHVVCESTGGYERDLAEACHDAGIDVSVVFPDRVRHYAKSQGRWAKTDPIDAGMIARFAQDAKPAPDTPKTQNQKDLEEAVGRRQQVQAALQSQRQQADRLRHKALRQHALESIAALERELAAIDAMLAEIASHDDYCESCEKLQRVPGIGAQSAISILAHCPELGRMNRRQAAALAGLAPFNADSGKKHGTRSIYGGRGDLRRCLYMCALTASVYHPELKEKYRNLLDRGKAKKVALTALMRHLLIILNAIMKQHLNQPQHP